MNHPSPAEQYTPGYTQTASEFMAQRSAASHAGFLIPHLRPSMRLLDCGCGPGSMSCDLAKIVAPGQMTGIDSEETQVERARQRADALGLDNATFRAASIYELPFADASFDVVFAHAVFEHLGQPEAALQEMHRVLVPGGIAAVRSPDWGGFLVFPEVPGLQDAIDAYAQTQTRNGGDVHVGRKLPALLRSTGFDRPQFSATYDCSQPPTMIAEYLALQLPEAEANALYAWSRQRDAVFAQSWCEVVGHKPA